MQIRESMPSILELGNLETSLKLILEKSHTINWKVLTMIMKKGKLHGKRLQFDLWTIGLNWRLVNLGTLVKAIADLGLEERTTTG